MQGEKGIQAKRFLAELKKIVINGPLEKRYPTGKIGSWGFDNMKLKAADPRSERQTTHYLYR